MTGLTCEERGAYSTVLLLIYERAEPIPDDDAWIASLLWCSVRTWKKLRAALIVKGKLFAVNYNGVDSLMNKRAADELSKTSAICAARTEAGKVGGRRSAEARSDRGNKIPKMGSKNGRPYKSPTKPNKINDNDQANASGLVNQTPSKREADIQTIRTSSVSPPNGEDTGDRSPEDPNKRAWTEAVCILVAQGGMTEPEARSFFGKLLRDHGLEARDMLSVLAEAFNVGTADPQGFMTKGAQARSRRRQQTGPPKRVGWV
jgi:uncharacterized protein YdaU (DUF1376 family)